MSFLRSSSEMAGGSEPMLGDVVMRLGEAGDAPGPGSEPLGELAPVCCCCWSAAITFCASVTICCSFGSRSESSCCAAYTQRNATKRALIVLPGRKATGSSLR